MSWLSVLMLSVVQGFTELLPVSSSAHVVVAEKLMGMNPSAPAMTLLLVSLHTGTMLAVLVYFWSRWRTAYAATRQTGIRAAWLIVLATGVTGVLGEVFILFIERVWLRSVPHAAVEMLFSHLGLIAPALAAAGILIIVAGTRREPASVLFPAALRMTPAAGVVVETAGLSPSQVSTRSAAGPGLTTRDAVIIGVVQAFCIPFRGFSRSGATISTGLLLGMDRARAEEFSFALAVALTPPAIARELWRLLASPHVTDGSVATTMGYCLLGVLGACLAGLLALRWLNAWLEHGRWSWFGIYCVGAAVVVGVLAVRGF